MTESAQSATRRRTRQAIIDAAASVLVRSPEAPLAEIAAAAETSRSTLHRSFADRAELIEAVVHDSIAAITAATNRAAVDEGTPVEALRRVVTAYLEIGDRIRFLFADPTFAARHPAIAELSAEEGPVIGLIARGQAEGSLDPACPPDWIERTIWALVYTASEAIDDGSLTRHAAPATLLQTIEHGILRTAVGDAG